MEKQAYIFKAFHISGKELLQGSFKYTTKIELYKTVQGHM